MIHSSMTGSKSTPAKVTTANKHAIGKEENRNK